MLSRGALGLASSRVRRGVVLSWSTLFILSLLLQYATFALAPAALAVHSEGLFELDKNASTQTTHDWNQVFADATNGTTTSGSDHVIFENDAINSTSDEHLFTGGQTKDGIDIDSWKWTTGPGVQDKNDIEHAYAAAYTNADGHQIVYFGQDRYAQNGDAFVGFWFLQNGVSEKADGTFNGVHADGDILVQVNFTNGGVISTFLVSKWESGGLASVANGVDCSAASTPANDNVCGVVNGDEINSPWPYTPKAGTANKIPAGGFFEAGIDLTHFGLDRGCFSTFISETRSSQPVTSTLSDYTLGGFSFCEPPTIATQVEQDGQSLGSVGTISKGDSVTDTATLTGSKGTVDGTVDFFRCFDASSTPDCSSGGTKTGVTKNLSGGKATSTAFTPANVGFYCFRVEYTPAAGSKYLAASHTNQTTECFQVLAATVTIGKTADDASVSAGDEIGFTLTWGNSGPGKATGVVVTDKLPGDAGLDWSIAGSTGTIAGNTAVSGTVHVTSDTTSATCGSVDNTGSITSDNDGSANASDSVVVNCPDVTVVKTAKALVLHVGDTAEWDIVVSNIGKGIARNVTVTDPLPGNITWQVSHAGCSIASSTLTCSLGDLAPNASVTIVVTGNTDTEGSETQDCIVLDNTATVASSNEPASAQGNNKDDASITVTCSSALVIDKDVSGNTGGTFNDPTDPNNPLNGLKQAKIGDTLTYTLHYAGAGPLTHVVITDPIPAGLAYVAGSATGDANFDPGVYDPTTRTITWNQPDPTVALPDPASGDVTFKVKVLAAAAEIGVVDNVATIVSDQTPLDDGEVPVGVLPPPEALTPPPTSTITARTEMSNPGFSLMIILLAAAAVTLAVGFVTPVPARSRRRNGPR
jgi:uncharacterized repeat protein (TIGR01451 family)